MTVQANGCRIVYNVTGVQQYSITYQYDKVQDVVVYWRGTLPEEQKIYALGIDYNIIGKQVIFIAGKQPTSGKLAIYRQTPITQESDYVVNGNIPAETVEHDYDKGALIDQELKDELDRCIKSDPTNTLPGWDYLAQLQALYTQLQALWDTINAGGGLPQALSIGNSIAPLLQIINNKIELANNIPIGTIGSVPVVVNGNVLSYEDLAECEEGETGYPETPTEPETPTPAGIDAELTTVQAANDLTSLPDQKIEYSFRLGNVIIGGIAKNLIVKFGYTPNQRAKSDNVSYSFAKSFNNQCLFVHLGMTQNQYQWQEHGDAVNWLKSWSKDGFVYGNNHDSRSSSFILRCSFFAVGY